ncbi:MAG: hypothetical protein KTR26_18975 [Flammeovirgaceae bacterium]|nr:hypothetical protein [Flammeovirgaceae bacterium]
MKLFWFSLFFMINSFSVLGQLNVAYVENWINSCNRDTNFKSMDRLYIVEGVPYGGQALEEVLESFDMTKRLWYIDYLISDSIETTFLKPKSILVIIGKTPKLKKNERAEKLKEIQSKFIDEFSSHYNLIPNPNDPVLIINGELISFEEAQKTIKEINPKNIRYIQYVNHTFFPLHGQNAKNGAVTIWTKQYARKKVQ